MTSWLAALTAVVLAAATPLPSSAQGATRDVRIDVLSVAPRPPHAAKAVRRRPPRRPPRRPRPAAGGEPARTRRATRVRPAAWVDPLQRLDRRQAIQKH